MTGKEIDRRAGDSLVLVQIAHRAMQRIGTGAGRGGESVCLIGAGPGRLSMLVGGGGSIVGTLDAGGGAAVYILDVICILCLQLVKFIDTILYRIDLAMYPLLASEGIHMSPKALFGLLRERLARCVCALVRCVLLGGLGSVSRSALCCRGILWCGCSLLVCGGRLGILLREGWHGKCGTQKNSGKRRCANLRHVFVHVHVLLTPVDVHVRFESEHDTTCSHTLICSRRAKAVVNKMRGLQELPGRFGMKFTKNLPACR